MPPKVKPRGVIPYLAPPNLFALQSPHKRQWRNMYVTASSSFSFAASFMSFEACCSQQAPMPSGSLGFLFFKRNRSSALALTRSAGCARSPKNSICKSSCRYAGIFQSGPLPETNRAGSRKVLFELKFCSLRGQRESSAGKTRFQTDSQRIHPIGCTDFLSRVALYYLRIPQPIERRAISFCPSSTNGDRSPLLANIARRMSGQRKTQRETCRGRRQYRE